MADKHNNKSVHTFTLYLQPTSKLTSLSLDRRQVYNNMVGWTFGMSAIVRLFNAEINL